MKFLYIIPALLLMGCTTVVPMYQPFPSAPSVLFEECGPLKTVEKDAKLSDLVIVVTENYVKFHECAIKNKAWAEWYKEQKEIFDQIP